MIGDFFTKLLQGAKFYKFRQQILNLDEATHIAHSPMTSKKDANLPVSTARSLAPQECVGATYATTYAAVAKRALGCSRGNGVNDLSKHPNDLSRGIVARASKTKGSTLSASAAEFVMSKYRTN